MINIDAHTRARTTGAGRVLDGRCVKRAAAAAAWGGKFHFFFFFQGQTFGSRMSRQSYLQYYSYPHYGVYHCRARRGSISGRVVFRVGFYIIRFDYLFTFFVFFFSFLFILCAFFLVSYVLFFDPSAFDQNQKPTHVALNYPQYKNAMQFFNALEFSLSPTSMMFFVNLDDIQNHNCEGKFSVKLQTFATRVNRLQYETPRFAFFRRVILIPVCSAEFLLSPEQTAKGNTVL